MSSTIPFHIGQRVTYGGDSIAGTIEAYDGDTNIPWGVRWDNGNTSDYHAAELTPCYEARQTLSELLLHLHKRTYDSVSDQVWGTDPKCESCGHQYPCDTVKLIKQY